MKGEKIIDKKLNFNVTTLVIHDKELSDRLLKEAVKEKTTNKTSLICDLLNEALDYRSGDYKDPCFSMLTNVMDNQNKMIEILFEIISKMDKKEIKDDIYHKLLCVIDNRIKWENQLIEGWEESGHYDELEPRLKKQLRKALDSYEQT